MISWKLKQQYAVAQRSKEAEFISLTLCVREVLWLKKLHRQISLVVCEDKVRRLFDICFGKDNQAYILEPKKPVVSKLLKQIDY